MRSETLRSHGNQGHGSFKNAPNTLCIEMPVPTQTWLLLNDIKTGTD